MSYEGELAVHYNDVHKRLLGSPSVAPKKPTLFPPLTHDKNSPAAILLRIEAIEQAIKRINRFLVEGERLEDKNNPTYPQLKTFPVEKLIKMVLEKEGLSRAEVSSGRRTSNLVMARHMIFYLCSRWTMRSLGEIGKTLGVQDHTTVMHGIRKMMLKRNADADLDIKLSQYEEKLSELVNIGDKLSPV